MVENLKGSLLVRLSLHHRRLIKANDGIAENSEKGPSKETIKAFPNQNHTKVYC